MLVPDRHPWCRILGAMLRIEQAAPPTGAATPINGTLFFLYSMPYALYPDPISLIGGSVCELKSENEDPPIHRRRAWR